MNYSQNSQIKQAIREKDLELICDLLPKIKEQSIIVDALDMASEKDDYKITQTIVPYIKGTIDNPKSLVYALYNSNIKIVRLLLPICNRFDKNNNKILDNAARYASLKIVKLILSHSDDLEKTNQALFNSAYNPDIKVMMHLLTKINPAPYDSYVLELAASLGRYDMVKILMPLRNPKDEDSAALYLYIKSQMKYGDRNQDYYDTMDLLIDACDTNKVLERFKFESNYNMPSYDYFVAKAQKKDLKEAISPTLADKKQVRNKRKII